MSVARTYHRVSGPFTASRSNGLQGKVTSSSLRGGGMGRLSTVRGNANYWVDAVWSAQVRVPAIPLLIHRELSKKAMTCT